MCGWREVRRVRERARLHRGLGDGRWSGVRREEEDGGVWNGWRWRRRRPRQLHRSER